jgi:hypothetical protein
MNKVATHKKVFPLLKSSVNIIFANPAILFPYATIIFIQLLILEVLYFSNRFPLDQFFAPMIRTLWRENFLHYPMNLFLLPELFQEVQIPLFVFVNSFFVAVSIGIISSLNSGKKINLPSIYKDTFKAYVHLVIAAILASILLVGVFKLYGFVYHRADMIRSTSGIYYILKRVFIGGTPYFSLLGSIFVTTLFAFVAPIIIVDKKKIFSALILNFKLLFKYFWTVLGIIFIPMVVFIVVLLLRNSLPADLPWPEIRMVILVISILLMSIIDAVVNTAITTFYLVDKEFK